VYTSLIIARIQQPDFTAISEIFREFDRTDMPERMGTVRRELFHFHDLYIHAQEFAEDHGTARVEQAKTDPRFVQISKELRPYFEAYDPTWASPKDAMASCFYRWTR